MTLGTTEQQAILAKMSKDERLAFDALRDSEKEAFFLSLQLTSQDVSEDGFETVGGGLEDCPIIGVKTEKNPFGMKDGEKFSATFLGTVVRISKEPKENWDQIAVGGKVYYTSPYYKFKRANGSVFGIQGYSGLWKLKRIATAATDPRYYNNPEVMVKYIGHIEGKERLKKEFGIEIASGNSSHVFEVLVKNAVALRDSEKTRSGVINYLNSPIPVETANDDGLTDVEIAARNYKLQVEAHQAVSAQIEAPAQSLN
jgi:hypothetical protein